MNKLSDLKKVAAAALALCMALVLMPGEPAQASDVSLSGATTLTFTDSGITAKDGDYTDYAFEGTALSIKGAGTYVVQGSCSDGSITVKKGVTGVTLVLKGLDLTSADTAPIACNKSTEVNIVAYAGTVNNLTDTEKNNDETYPENENAENAVIKTKDGSKVTISGTGTINVNSYGKNGVKGGATTEEEGESSLTIEDVTLNIKATVNDGLKSDQELNILSGTVTVSAADDGIKSDYVLNIGAEGTAGPTVTVTDSKEGIEGATVNIYSGNVTVNAADDGINAANSDLTNYDFSCNIYGGKVWVNVTNGDGIDSNGTVDIEGGIVEIYTPSQGDGDPLDSDGGLTIGEGATVLGVGTMGMGLNLGKTSQPYVTFGGGTMGGRTGGMMGGQRPDGMTRPTDDAQTVPQNGQAAMPDMPLDNGLTGTGFGPRGGMNGQRPDFGQMPDMNGQQGQQFGLTNQSGAAAVTGGETFTITDESGKAIYTATAVRNASFVFFTSPALESGKTYTLTSGSSTATATASDAASGFGGRTGGFNGQQGQLPQQGQNGQTVPQQGQSGQTIPQQGQNGQTVPQQGQNGQTVPGQSGKTQGRGRFSDVQPQSWYAAAVDYCDENGLMSGVSETSFAPASTMSRAMLATVLYRAAKAQAPAAEASFTDVRSGAWYADAVSWAAAENIVNGYPDGGFHPDEPVTREQLAAILCRYAKGEGSADTLTDYADAKTVSGWAADAMGWAVKTGVLKGADNKLNPTGTATRAEAAQMLMNFFN